MKKSRLFNGFPTLRPCWVATLLLTLVCSLPAAAQWRVGVTAGASAPESLVQGVLEWLKTHVGADDVRTLPGVEENVAFPLPKGLRECDLADADAAR